MPCEGIWMRCGEWWASSLDLRGSWHPYPLLPITHLAGFFVCYRWCLKGVIYRGYRLLFQTSGWFFSGCSPLPGQPVGATQVFAASNTECQLFWAYIEFFLHISPYCTFSKPLQQFESQCGCQKACWAIETFSFHGIC